MTSANRGELDQEIVLVVRYACLLQKLKLGVPIRDMRLLDPNLLTSETGKILVRDNVIVVSIEHVRVIITADCVIIPRDGFEHNPLNTHFNSLLEEVIQEFAEVSIMLTEKGVLRSTASLKYRNRLLLAYERIMVVSRAYETGGSSQ